jgi:hypothetical protein
MIKPAKVFRLCLLVVCIAFHDSGYAQNPGFHIPMSISDTAKPNDDSTILRIRNLNPYFTLHVDSTLSYQLELNKDPTHFFFFMKNAPVGLKIRENGLLTFRAESPFFFPAG